MNIYDIVLIPFPFADLSSTKKRPCIVISKFSPRALGEHLIVAMVTSKVDNLLFPYDIKLENYKEAGLPLPSIVRLSRIVTIEKKIVIKKLGSISDADKKKVKREFKNLFDEII